MIFLRRKEEIEIIKEGAQILSKTHGAIAAAVRPGVSTKELNSIAEAFIKDHGAAPSFKGYDRYPFALCTSVNEGIVHGLPGDRVLCEGDIVSIDCGVYYKGYHSDSAFTYPIGKVNEEVLTLLRVTKEALYLGIKEAVVGKCVGDIGYVVQQHAEKHGYSVVRELVGHGVGRNLHESPEIPNYGHRGKGPKLRSGMVMAIEPMINLGIQKIVYGRDKWSISAADKKPSAHFEHTVAILEDKTEILTTFKYIEDVFKF